MNSSLGREKERPYKNKRGIDSTAVTRISLCDLKLQEGQNLTKGRQIKSTFRDVRTFTQSQFTL